MEPSEIGSFPSIGLRWKTFCPTLRKRARLMPGFRIEGGCLAEWSSGFTEGAAVGGC